MRLNRTFIARIFGLKPKKKAKRRMKKKPDLARLKAKNGAILEFDLKYPRDSIIPYGDFWIAVIRRKGYLLRAHITKLKVECGRLVYEGDILSFSSPFKKKKPRKKALTGV